VLIIPWWSAIQIELTMCLPSVFVIALSMHVPEAIRVTSLILCFRLVLASSLVKYSISLFKQLILKSPATKIDLLPKVSIQSINFSVNSCLLPTGGLYKDVITRLLINIDTDSIVPASIRDSICLNGIDSLINIITPPPLLFTLVNICYFKVGNCKILKRSNLPSFIE